MNEQISTARQNHFIKGFPIFFKFKNLSQDWLMSLTEEELIQKLKQFEPFHFSSRFMKIFHFTSRFLGFWNTQMEMGNLSEFRTVMLVYYRLFQRCFGRHGVQFSEVRSLQNSDVEILRKFVTGLTDSDIYELFKRAHEDLQSRIHSTPSTNLIKVLHFMFPVSGFDQELLNELKDYLDSDPNICLVPSSGRDFSAENFFSTVGNNLFGVHSVFIHIDRFSQFLSINHIFPNSQISKANIEINCFGIANLEIFKIDQNGLLKWVLFFNQSLNEAVVKIFIQNKVRIETILCKLDGITHGNGRPEEGYAVSTPLYTLFSNELRIKRAISEYSTNFFNNRGLESQNYLLQEFKKWVQSEFSEEISRPILLRIQDQSFSQLIIQEAEEHLINDKFSPYIQSDYPFSLFVFKTI
jgi:hypothetical protein